jgi:hypothetical protein
MSLSPSAVRWLLLGFWAALGINNIMKIDLNLGYDSKDHYEYIFYVSKTWSIPLATQGWQMFQSPLYYAISAICNDFFSLFFNVETSSHLIRIIL